MATIINRTRGNQAQLAREGKVRRMTSPADRAVANRINNQVKKVRRDYELKNSQSQISAAHMILTS